MSAQIAFPAKPLPEVAFKGPFEVLSNCAVGRKTRLEGENGDVNNLLSILVKWYFQTFEIIKEKNAKQKLSEIES